MNIQRHSTQAILKLTSKKRLSLEDVSLLMSEVRKLLDGNSVWLEKFRLLHFYCDWCQHDKLDRNPDCIRVIEDLNKCLWQIDGTGVFDGNKPMDVSGFLKTPQLLKELEFVLTAVFAKKIVPTYTFIYALFKYLAGIPIVPVDSKAGRLAHNSKEYLQLCSKLKIDVNRPLFKNLTIEDAHNNTISYICQMDGVETELKGIIEFPYCTSFPFEVSEIETVHTNDPWNEKMSTVLRLSHEGATQDAYNLLLKMQKELDGMHGLDSLRNDVNLLCFEMGWALKGDIRVFRYGELAAETTTDSRRASPIFHNLSLYSLQKGMISEAEKYLQKCLQHSLSNHDKASCYQLKGRILQYKNELDNALEAFLRAEEYADMAHQNMRKARIIINIAEILFSKGLIQMAISELNRCMQFATELHDLNTVIRCSVKKAQFYFSMGDDETGKKIVTYIPQQLD